MAGFHRMIDMARSPEEVKKDMPAPVSSSPEISGPTYPWGLCINLCDEQLDKLDIDSADIKVGDTIHLFAMAKVTSYSENAVEMAGGKNEQRRRVELQITHLGLEDEDREDMPDAPKERARKRYGEEDSPPEKASYRD